MTEAELVLFDDTAPAWERAFYAFLAEKERRSGSKRTVDAYSPTLQRFFVTLGKPPDQVTSQDIFVFAHGRGPSGRSSSPSIWRSPLEEPIHTLYWAANSLPAAKPDDLLPTNQRGAHLSSSVFRRLFCLTEMRGQYP